MNAPLPRLAVLGSGQGSNFLAIQKAIREHHLAAQIVLVISDLPEAKILTHAADLDLPTHLLPASPFRTKLSPEGEQDLLHVLQEHAVEWVVLAGYMRVVKEPLLSAYAGRILNIHPSLLPHFRGLRAWQQALEAKVGETGCTVHYVNAEIDGGEIVAQHRVPIFENDTPETLHARIQHAEHELYPAALAKVLEQTPTPR